MCLATQYEHKCKKINKICLKQEGEGMHHPDNFNHKKKESEVIAKVLREIKNDFFLRYLNWFDVPQIHHHQIFPLITTSRKTNS